jgi:hypothetical protein
MVIGYMAATVAVPARVAVPLPLSWKVTPLGRMPVPLSAGVGVPVAVTVNPPADPAVNVVLAALVIAAGVPVTVRLAVPELDAKLVSPL